MHHYNGLPNGLDGSPLFPSWPGCIINTSGYDFRKGHLFMSLPEEDLRAGI
jgi:hypothetical protein